MSTCSGSSEVILAQKHFNAIWRAQDAVKREEDGASRGDDVFFWPLDQRFLKLKLKLKMMSKIIFF
jgi:hypothetical protein